MDWIGFIFLGVLIGTLSAFFGIGGGTIAMPVLIFLGFSPITAVATSTIVNAGASLSGVIAHFQIRNVIWKTSLIIGFSGFLSTQIFHPVVLYVQSIGWDTWLIPCLYICALSLVVFSMIFKKEKDQKGMETKYYLMKCILIGLLAGFLSIMIGVGGGFLIVPLLISLLHFKPKLAIGTSLLAVFIIAISGFSLYAMSGYIDITVGLALVLGTLIGCQIGARQMKNFTNLQVRYLLIGLYSILIISQTLSMLDIAIWGMIAFFTYCLFVIISFLILPKSESLKPIKEKRME